MKILFLVFHGFAEHNGISKKIFAQRDALAQCGAEVRLCWLEIDEARTRKRMVDDLVLENYGSGLRGGIRSRIAYGALADYIVREGIGCVYLRYDHNASPFLTVMLCRLKRAGVGVAAEIPTYPYDREYDTLSLKFRVRHGFDRMFRRAVFRQVDRVVTFSGFDRIFGAPTVNISNGIDFSKVPIKSRINDTERELHLIGVAEIHPWHGFDRAISGLADYYAVPRDVQIYFHVVGEGDAAEREKLTRMAGDSGLGDRVIFHGAQAGTALDALFERADMGVASLARHRSGITRIKTLKNREYAARGIPFVYSETDEDFDGRDYVMKAPADETPLDMESILRFYRSRPFVPAEIRASVEGSLSWKMQMQKVLDAFTNKK